MSFHFNIPCSDRNAAEAGKPAAIVQPAARNWQFYESTLLKMDENKGKMLDEYKNGGTWRERYKTWIDACVPLNLSVRHIDRLIERERFIKTECPNVDHKKESVALKQVEEARPTKATEAPPAIPDFLKTDEELEKPRVKTAQESIADTAAKNGHVNGVHRNGKENGKPLNQLAVWKKAEDTFGALLRAIDDVHRACPSKSVHDRIINGIKNELNLFEQWKGSVK